MGQQQPHPKYQNNNKDNNLMKMSKFDLTESYNIQSYKVTN